MPPFLSFLVVVPDLVPVYAIVTLPQTVPLKEHEPGILKAPLPHLSEATICYAAMPFGSRQDSHHTSFATLVQSPAGESGCFLPNVSGQRPLVIGMPYGRLQERSTSRTAETTWHCQLRNPACCVMPNWQAAEEGQCREVPSQGPKPLCQGCLGVILQEWHVKGVSP